ncbi:sensor histidine kinase [Desulfofalx alkaliphila]|uniref:sensor histidine kinase n=1 Tax=Desulfofalx alkaliphila TaxID=105483 RepID=UPI00068FBDF9|nr:sensor histidine kinase [Desulfofalx alkaliphila]
MSTLTDIQERSDGLRCTPEIMGGWRAMVIFRFISWFLTSVFYLFNPGNSLFSIKLLVIISLLAFGLIISYLYEYNKDTDIDKMQLVVIETLGIALFLIPTGGLSSPFIWYALNPIFMTALLLPNAYYWITVVIFLASSSLTSIYFSGIGIFELWKENQWLLLVFLLLITVSYLFAQLIKHLADAYNQLSTAYNQSEQLLKHNSNLYQALESVSAGSEPSHLAEVLAAYARKLSGAQATMCCLMNNGNRPQWLISDPDNILEEHINSRQIDIIWDRLNYGQEKTYTFPLDDGDTKGQLVCVPLQSLDERFGFLAYVVPRGINKGDLNRAIIFLAELGAIVMERQKADELSARLMVIEEQNRIANEIHDGVSQYLFSIVYALHSLAKKEGSLQEDEIKEQLELIGSTASKAARELRSSIYRISPRRRGEQVFVANLSSYLEGLAQLNKVKVDFQTEGLEDTISPALRKALYRVVREATSNAIRHGKCRTIKVNLQMEPSKVKLEIADDGGGFDVDKLTKPGLGLANMNSLIKSFNGRFSIKSNLGEGTRISCVIPDN